MITNIVNLFDSPLVSASCSDAVSTTQLACETAVATWTPASGGLVQLLTNGVIEVLTVVLPVIGGFIILYFAIRYLRRGFNG